MRIYYNNYIATIKLVVHYVGRKCIFAKSLLQETKSGYSTVATGPSE